MSRRKFQIGDRVRVKYGDGGVFIKGNIGIVCEIRDGVPYPYYIRWGKKREPFMAENLELVKRKKK